MLIQISILADYSLRSQHYGRYKTLVSQCLSTLLDRPELQQEEYSDLKVTIERLKDIMEAKLKLTAEEDLMKDRMLYKMLQDNEKIEVKIGELRKEREEGEGKFDNLLRTKLEVIDKHRSYINEMNDKSRSYLNEEM